MLGNNLAVLDVKTFKIPEAHAQEVAGPIVDTPMEHDEIGLIALLVESDLLEDQAIKSRIKTYARNAQERTPHSQSLIIKVDKNEETYNVAKLLEKLYFEGIDTDVIDGNPINNNSVKEDNNKLIGIVVIGDVPIPVVTESGGDSYPSMYPYTDFYRKRFIYNHETDKFEENSDVPFPNPEVWHGVIVPPSKDAVQSRTELIEYFDKNEKYSDGDSEFTDFNKRMLYLNHPAMEKKMNYMDFGNYLRYIAFMEEMSFNRYNKHLLKELIKWVSSDMGAEEPVMPDEAIDAMLDVSTEFIFKQYTSPLAMALKIYRGQLNGAFKDTGRWYGNKVDTADELITYRDEYAKTTLRKKQLMLEKEVDDFIKEEVPAEERKAEITTSAELKIKTDIPVIGEGTKHYTFFTYIDGKKVSEMNTVEDCGINVGQERGADEEVLENNSVYVEANRMYNPETLIEPPNDEDWKLEEDGDYIDYAGCVFNNSYEIDTGKMLLSPSNCNVRMSNKPIFDIVGSKEIEDETGGNRCSYSRMTFSTGDDGVFNNNAKSGGASEVKLKNVINHVYGVFVNDGTITEKPDISMREKASDVVKALVNTGRTIHYEPDIPLLDVVDMYISAEINGTGEIDDYSTHVEPTNETIQAIKQEKTDTCGPNGSINFPQIVTPSTPADGIRYTEFQREDEKRRFDYMNLYRIGGNNIEEIENNLEEEISSKEVELEQAVGTPTNLLINSFAEGIDADNNIIWKDDIDEPIIWNTLNVDQKLANIIQKYTDRDSVMPTPNYIVPHIPQMKPNGYEVLHIVAEGDPWGYTYGLNRAMVNQMQGSEFGEATVEDEQGDGVGDSATTGDEGGGNDDENNYVCGDPKGVEIWEWFDALQCWIEEEILPASELFKLDETCGTLATAPENQQEEIAFPDPMDDTTTKAVDIEAEMDRKSLVVGQEESIFVYPINANGNSVMGYLDEVVHLELADSSLGSFSKNDFHFFKGEDEVKFTAEKTGTTQLRITMGDIELQPAITIHIYDSINLHWSSELQQSGNQNSYKINVDLRTPSGDQVTDVNTVIYLAPAKPTDGGFTNKGKNQLVAGEGETEFVPMAGPTKIDLIEKDPFYTSAPYSINPPASPAVKLAVDSPGYIEIGETKEIPITAVSTFGTIATGFNNNITISLSEDTEKYAKVITANVQMVNGKGKAIIQGGKDTADIKIIAEYPNLQSGEGAIPILARVDSEDWMGKYPQNLFASFVGFPAGDFFEENYFGGIHLFNGKTEAVYSFLTGNNPAPEVYVMPNYQVKTTQPQQKVYLEFPNNQILLQVFDQIKLQTLLSKNIQLNFNEVIEWEEESKLEVNKMYVEVLSDIFTSKTIENGIELLDYEGNEVLRLQKNNIDLINPSYSFYYNNEPELDVLEIILSDGSEDITRVMLNFEPVQMEPENFNEISDKYVAKKVYSGNGTNKPNGLILYNPAGDMPEDDKGEYFGLQGENNYLQLFAGGSSAGESTRFNLPANAVLLGDPTIQLDLSPSGGLDYDYSKGRKIFQDPNGSQIASMTYFNFNNDAYEDVALVMKDGRVRLMEGGPTEPEYRDRGDIAFLSDGAVAIEAFDFQKDGYEDLVVGTNEGRLAILNNDKELISRTNQDIKIGKQLYQLRKGDMDADGEEDLTVLDSRGDILVFYYENGKFKENGKLLGNYGFSIKDTNLYKDLEIRYQGLATPNTTLGLDLSALPDTEPGTPVLEASDSQLDAITNLINGNASNPSEDDSKALIEAAAALQEAIKNNPEAAAGLNGPPMLPWAEDDQTKTYFEPAENLSFLTITKTVRNKDRPDSKNVDLEEKLIYNITITSSINLSNFVIADTVPDSLSADMTTINCSGVGCPEMLDTQESGIRMFIGEMNLKANQPLYLDYEASVKHTPQAAIMVQKLTQPNAINDQYLDVIVSPPYNNTQDFIQHYSTGSRSYSIRSTSEDAKPPSADLTAILDNNSFIEALTNFSTQEFSGDNPPDLNAMPTQDGACEAVAEAMGTSCFESADSTTSCANDALDDLAAKISDFSCMGGGCFPMPFNKAFLVPGGIGPALPMFAFPTTLVTPVGTMPFLWPPMILGSTYDFPGAIMSMLRFYLSPTLTGGMGIAMCWGPYMGSITPPPPVFPIPYPPPIGNCMVMALPKDALPWGKLCDKIEEGMEKLMGWINSGMSKMNSAMAGVNNNQSVPVEFTESGGGEQGAGGLEVSLGVNLGNSMKFEPPAKGFSNTHIPTFDTFMGKISDWVDRQTMELTTKLFRLPTFYIYLPDFQNLWNKDFESTQKVAKTWFEQMSKSAEATGKALDKISKEDRAKDVKDVKFFKYMDAIDTQSNLYNTSIFEGLYDVANTLPILNITETPVEFKIPWVSANDIQAYIIELQKAGMHYEREWNRVKDKWDLIQCPQEDSNETEESKKIREAKCLGREIGDLFALDFEPFLESIQENIEVLESYQKFPREFVLFKAKLIDYIRGVACYVNVIGQMMGGWMATIREQLISWAELILTLQEIIKNWKKLFDLFINFDTNCSICTNERWANFGWFSLLGLIIPDIPIIKFPKWPDVVFDISNIDAAVNIELPMLVITPEPLPFPPIPLITLPDFPNIDLLLQMPPLPVLPRLPDLPDLPDLPPLPVVELPTLPPPPKLPDMGKSLEVILNLVEKILKVWCLMKKSFAPVPESSLGDQITLLTNRPAYLIPLDVINIKLPDIALFDLGFNEIRIETIVYLGLRLQFLPKILEDLSGTWNGWIEEIPKKMDEFYKEWDEGRASEIQEFINKFEDKMDNAADLINQGCIELDENGNCINTIQGEIDENVGGAFQDAEDSMQNWMDEQKDEFEKWATENNINPNEWNYDSYVTAINNANANINRWSNEVGSKIDDFFNKYGDFVTGIGYMVPFADKLDEIMTLYDDANEAIQENILDNVGKGIDYSIGVGVTGMDKLFEYMDACKNDIDACDDGDQYFSSANTSKEIEYTNSIRSLVAELKTEINKLNNAELVDYKKVKEDLNVKDYALQPKTTIPDKIDWMENELYAYSDRLEEEVKQMKDVKDLYALAEVPPNTIFPYELVNADLEPVFDDSDGRVFSSAVIPKDLSNLNEQTTTAEKSKMDLETKVESLFNASDTTDTNSNDDESSCRGMCLPDPTTNYPTPAIPSIEFPLSSETLFMPSGDLIYSDGNSLYLKRKLSASVDQANEGRNSYIAELSVPDLFESVNMMKTVLTGNGSSSFSWLPNTNEELYGYSIEVEKSIVGFDTDKQNNGYADTRIILLPPDENGNPPEVYAGDKLISYGTFVTSRLDAEEAQEHFGMKFNEVITGVQQIRFPTLGNGSEDFVINLNENKSFILDKYISSSYSLNMVNGYYHVKMTWFNKNGVLSSYNQSELIAPQIYVGGAPPIDMAFDKEFYVPVFKDKTINASDIFADLAGSYEYFWYVDVENNPLTPVISDQLVIAPQQEPKEIMVKLVASLDMEDDGFEKYEKLFKVNVYVPEITLEVDPLQEGVVSGNMSRIKEAPTDDLSSIPFSLFRKRWNTWKNLGQIMFKNNKQTVPPFNDNEDRKYIFENSYYSQDAEGNYSINGFDTNPNSPVIFKDSEGNTLIRVIPGTGRIELLKDGFELLPLPASKVFPTRIAIMETATDLLAGNVYYMPDSNTDITILDGPLTSYNVEEIGVTAGDGNPNDDIIARNIPGFAPSYPGGIAIYNQTPPQKNIALVDTDGSIRMMQAGYKLKLKNEFNSNEPYIFQIITDDGEVIYEIYIAADYYNLVITDEIMNDTGIQIGLIGNPLASFASLIAQTDTSEITNQKSQTLPTGSQVSNSSSPFPDLDSTHPFFKEILQLYAARIISGYADGSFQADGKLTRAEFIKIALGVTNCYDCTLPTDAQREKYTPRIPFPDVRLPAWYYFCIWIAKDLEMITGYGDGFFRPEQNISRAEAAAVLLRQSQIEITEAPDGAFADVPDYAWYKDYVYTAVDIGLIKENAGFVFPDEQITRGEFAFMGSGVMNMLDCHEIDEDKDGIPDWWEMENNMDPLFAGDAPTDVDFDGMTALQEYLNGTDPNNPDSDGDDIPDATDEILDIDFIDKNENGIDDITGEVIKEELECPCIDNPNQDDTDGDGIIDACDEDLDDDSVSNLICIFDDNGDPDEDMVDDSEDNCVFVANTNQEDVNNNGIGDICEECPCIDNPNQNDTDGDGIIDACDEDLDNDGITNLICLFDDDGILDDDKADESDDNCIFNENPDQTDSDFNETGDVCEPYDLCPTIPEDLDGVNDEDGCPEVDDEFPDKESGVYITPGPACNFIDYEADLIDGDIIMTAITDVVSHEIIFEKSNEITYEP